MKNFKVCSWCVSLCVFDAQLCVAQEYRYKSKESKSVFDEVLLESERAAKQKKVRCAFGRTMASIE